MDNGRYVGCGPTSGAMILDTYDNRLTTPGDLVPDPLDTAWNLHHNYMNTDESDSGRLPTCTSAWKTTPPTWATIWMSSFTSNRPRTITDDWDAYTVGDDLVTDATFWNTTGWDIYDLDFLNFIKPEIDVGDPVMLTVDSDGKMARSLGGRRGLRSGSHEWAGYNTWDSSLHWYDVESAFIAGNTMGVGFVRTFDFVEMRWRMTLDLGSRADDDDAVRHRSFRSCRDAKKNTAIVTSGKVNRIIRGGHRPPLIIISNQRVREPG